MRASVEVRLSCGETVVLGHGDLVGRVPNAALFLDDPRVSEAHAMVSLRGGRLTLLSLRRLVAVDGQPRREIPLEEGMRLEFASQIEVEVGRVRVPDRLLALQGPGMGLRLLAGTTSLVDRAGAPRAISRFVPDAAAHVWWSGEQWTLRQGNGDQRLEAGATITVGAHEVRAVEVMARSLGTPTSREGGIAAPLRLTVAWDTAEIVRADHPPLVLGGTAARILSELVAMGGSVRWELVAGEVWSDRHPDELRARWDVTLNRLRKRLRDAEIRPSLVAMDGSGHVVLSLGPEDVVEDRT